MGDYRTAGALLAYRTGPPGRVHNQPNHLGAGGVPLSRRPGHGNGLEHRSRAAQLLHHHAGGRSSCRQARRRRRPRRCTSHWRRTREHRAHLTPGQELLFACRYRLGTASNFVVYVSRPTTSTTHCTAAPGARPRCTSQCRAEARVSDGGADNVTLATLVLLEPNAHHAWKFSGRSNSQSWPAHCGRLPAGGLRHDLSAFAWNMRAPTQDAAPSAAGTSGTARGSLEHGAPGLLGAAGRNREAALRSLWRVYPRR